MTELKRDKVKYIRDKAKSKYEKDAECYICRCPTNLDFHHYYSITGLLKKWEIKNPNLEPEDVIVWRDDFITDHIKELYDDTVTLCRAHHLQLHSIYGKEPCLATAKKQARWVGIQRDKHELV